MATGNTQPASARTFVLGTRRDGEASVIGKALFKVGEVAPIWIETAPYCGGVYIDSADNPIVTPPTQLAIDSVTLQDTKIEVMLNATLAVASTTYNVVCDIHPEPVQTIKAEVEVEIEAT